MLSKLYKHELKATSKYLIPMYLILIAVSILDRMVLTLDIFHGVLSVIPAFMTAAYIISIFAVVIVTFVLMILRFYKNLLSDEGYLMFTLPVKSNQLIMTKLITSSLWTIISIVIVVISLFLAFATPDGLRILWLNLESIFEELKLSFGNSYILLILEFIVMMVVGLFQNMLLIYFAIAVGQLFNGRRLLGSFIAYVVINTASTMAVSILLGTGGIIFRNSLMELKSIPNLVFPVSIIVAMVLNGIYYYGTNYIFKNKLNLE